jgi:hypothetical protein
LGLLGVEVTNDQPGFRPTLLIETAYRVDLLMKKGEEKNEKSKDIH